MYCLTRKDSESMARHMVERGISAGFYHADMDAGVREQVHRCWTTGEPCPVEKQLGGPCSTC